MTSRWALALTAGLLGLSSIVTGCGAEAASSAAVTFRDPVYKGDFPDPFVLRVGKTFYAYATQGNNENIQMLSSHDLVHWKEGHDAMPVTATWLTSNTWAPEVLHRGNGAYVMYYGGHDMKSDRECIGVATSRSPAGPFRDRSNHPFICQARLGGSIDPDAFRDTNGKLYLVWKNDGNCCGITTYLWSQRLSSDGLHLEGKAVKLVHTDQGWEGSLIEAPTLWKHGGKYYLFFSANDYASLRYAVGYATCKGPMGPCTHTSGSPILKTTACSAGGPGHQAIITDGAGQTWMVYHAWTGNAVGYDAGGERQLWIDRLDWKNGKPVVHGPTCAKQRAPAPA